MFEYRVTIDDGPLNLDRIANSGQMFRWTMREPDGWNVYDGGDWYGVGRTGSELAISSNRERSSFEKLFRLERSHQELLDKIVGLGPEMEPFLLNREGLRLMRPASKTETLFSFLCSAHNHVTRITKMVWYLASLGEFAFPSITRLAKVSEEELRTAGFGYRGATIPKVAQILAANGGEAYLDELAHGGYEEARKELIALPGVGKKLADCICLFALDYGESVPVDTHIWQVMTRLYYPHWQNTSLTDTKYETVAGAFRDRFGELAGAAHQFLFVDNMERYRERSSG